MISQLHHSRDPSLLIPGVADEKNLAPAYEVLHKAIRSVDQQHSIFFEGVTWDFFAAGFKQVPGGAAYSNRSVLSYHYYEPPDFNKQFQFEVRMEDLKRLKCGGFLTEFWTTGLTTKARTDMFEIMDITDKYMLSWMGWLYKPYGCNRHALGCLIPPIFDQNATQHEQWLQNTSRTYPQAVAGKTWSYKYDRNTQDFDLIFTVSTDCKSTETIVYFNEKLHYPNGFTVTTLPSGKISWHKVGNLIFIEHDKDLSPRTEVRFALKKK